jgi:Tetratricopeptide repeat
MTPARSRQTFPDGPLDGPPDSPMDIAGLWDALEASTDRLGRHHSETLGIAHTLAISLWHVGDVQSAATILNQAVASLTSSFGTHHPATLAAKGDFAALLFELGRDAEASSLELEAFEMARTHLGKAHAVTTVLAWNRAINCERYGNLDAAGEIVRNELTWLLARQHTELDEDQNIIRGMLVERLKWDDAPIC